MGAVHVWLFKKNLIKKFFYYSSFSKGSALFTYSRDTRFNTTCPFPARYCAESFIPAQALETMLQVLNHSLFEETAGNG